MLFLLNSLCLSNSDVYQFRSVDPGDSIAIDLNKGSSSAFVFWQQKMDNAVSVDICNKTTCTTISDINDNSLQLIGENATVNFNSKNQIYLWKIPKSICGEKNVAYATTHVITDTLSLNENIDSICLFFANSDSSISFSISTNDKSRHASIASYTESSLPKESSKCKGSSCSTTFKEPFFINIKNVTRTATISMDFDMKHSMGSDGICSRSIFRVMKDGKSSIENLNTKTSDTTCESRISPHDISGIVELLFGLLVVVIAIILCSKYLCRTCSKGKELPYHDVDSKDAQPQRVLASKNPDDDDVLVIDTENIMSNQEKNIEDVDL